MPSANQNKTAGKSPRFWKITKNLAGEKDGATAIEFAILALPFFMLVFAILETCISFAAQQLLSNAMDDAARKVRTGNSQAITEADLKTAVCGKLQMMVRSGCDTYLQVDLRNYPTFAKAANVSFDITGGNTINIIDNGTRSAPKTDPGGPATINSLRVFYRWPVITDIMRKYMSNIDGNRTLLFSTVTWQNEPFPVVTTPPTTP